MLRRLRKPRHYDNYSELYVINIFIFVHNWRECYLFEIGMAERRKIEIKLDFDDVQTQEDSLAPKIDGVKSQGVQGS